MEEPGKCLKHFSHEHPLEYITTSRFDRNHVCSSCKITISPNNFFYSCKLCRFSLHKVCYTMPKKVTHPADQNHYLNLTASYITNQSNDCNACGRHIDGFYYNCTKCCLYYHVLCVALPLSVRIASSHPHILKLEVKPPYDFRCDLCDGPSSSGWLYRCGVCEFDAHVSCAVKGTQSLHQRNSSSLGDKDNRMREAKVYQHELMELLSEAMKRVEVNRDDESNTVGGDSALPSYQFSDACFSIDLAKSILVEVKTQKCDFGKKELKRELSVAPSTGIRSRVWEELGHENVNTIMDGAKLNHQTTVRVTLVSKIQADFKRPFWSKLLMCS